MATIEIRKVLSYYIQVVIRGDIEKIKSVVSEVEQLERLRNPLKFPEPTPSIKDTPVSTTESSVTTTTAPPSGPGDLYKFDPSTARCAIPMAMSLMATAELLGAILKFPYQFSFRQSIENFCTYGGYLITPDEREILAAIFRNGMMHGFFPQGEEIAVAYQSTLVDPRLLVLDNQIIVLNVKSLAELVSKTVEKMFADHTIHSVMQRSFDEWYRKNKDSAKDAKNAFRGAWIA